VLELVPKTDTASPEDVAGGDDKASRLPEESRGGGGSARRDEGGRGGGSVPSPEVSLQLGDLSDLNDELHSAAEEAEKTARPADHEIVEDHDGVGGSCESRRLVRGSDQTKRGGRPRVTQTIKGAVGVRNLDAG
jgi:hypothetical protein